VIERFLDHWRGRHSGATANPNPNPNSFWDEGLSIDGQFLGLGYDEQGTEIRQYSEIV
jgi:hypothetical protein